MNALVRLALFNESRRVPLRREEINRRGSFLYPLKLSYLTHSILALNGETKQFKLVYAMAQKTLQNTFGMELTELMSRNERDQAQNGVDEDNGGEDATGLKKKGR